MLDIQLGATCISSPPLGLAAGGLNSNSAAASDPWGTPARAASQMSDPWTGTASPPVDPWQPASASRSTPLSAAHMAGMGMSNVNGGGDVWVGMRTQSPSVTSGSSTEGWLQSNGNSHNAVGGAIAAAAAVDPWQSKTTATAVNASAKPPSDPWLTEPNAIAVASPKPEDPWAPKAVNDDPWMNIENNTTKVITKLIIFLNNL